MLSSNKQYQNEYLSLITSCQHLPTLSSYYQLTEVNLSNLQLNKNFFQPIKFLHSHQQSNDDLTTISIHMCAFEPNTTKNNLATCGGQKVCFIDCSTCEITHLFEVNKLISTNRKIKDKNRRINKEYFSCLCWIEIENLNENLKILAVGATNGHIYLLSPKWNIMFGHIELPVSNFNMSYLVRRILKEYSH
jgi:hypothetical protein